MAYLLECQVCSHRIEVTDPVAPPGTQCPACASFHVLVPVTVRPKVTLYTAAPAEHCTPAPRAELAPTATGSQPADESATWQTATTAEPAEGIGAAVRRGSVGAGERLRRPRDVRPPVGILEPRPATKRRPIDRPQVRSVVCEPYEPPESSAVLVVAGPVGLLLGVAAVVCACIPAVSGFAAPLCAAGLLAGLAGAIVDDGTDRSRLVPTGAAAACGMLLVLFLFPGLGSALRFGRSDTAVDPTAVSIVPLTGDALGPGVDDAGWVDASRAGLQQNRVGVQIVSATLSQSNPGPGRSAAAPTLVVRLRVQRIWNGEQKLSEAPDQDRPPPADEPPAKLTDDTGKAYPPLPAPAADAAADKSTPTFVFEAPPSSYKFLRLELAAATWGGTGSLRFKIPNTMIHAEPAKGHRLGPAGTR